MRIAIASDWFAPRRGGIEGQLLQLAERLGARGHTVDVLTSTPGATGGGAFRTRPLELLTLPKVQLVVSPALISTLHRELRRGYDLVHAHVSVVSPVGYAAAVVARSLGLATVVTFHSVLRHKRHLLRAANALAGISRSAATWSAVSDLVAGQVRDALSGTEVSVLPNGIDLAFWKTPPRTTPPRQPGVVTLVSTMRLHRKKRPKEMLRAFVRAAEGANARARLLILGDGPERSALEREIHRAHVAEHGVHVESLGWRERDELRSIYAQADGFVLASTRESFGIAALEARAAGLPVIAMAASGSNEFLTHDRDAMICDDDTQLTRSIARFIDDAALRAKLAASPPALERYDWNAVIAAHESIYDRARTRAVAAGLVAASA